MNEEVMQSAPALEVRGLVRTFGSERAVSGVDWTVPRGSACALLGPNGAGKSTTLRMLAGLIRATEGSARVLGLDAWEDAEALTRRTAYVPEAPFLPPWMTLRGLLDLHRPLFPHWEPAREAELMARFQLPADQRLSSLSKGQNRRAHLVLALCQGAELLLLDEPGSGLDVEGRRELLSALAAWMADDESRSLVLSTHLVTDVERLADRVTVVANGETRADASLDEMRADVKAVELPREVYDRLSSSLEGARVLSAEVDDRRADVVVGRFRALEPALRTMGPGDVTVAEGDAFDHYVASDGASVRVVHLPLEDTYLALVRDAQVGVAQ